jgi:flagellar assembly protein FliH
MVGRLRLEVFEPAATPAAAAGSAGAADPVTEADERALGAFENGYKAGWDDAVAALEDGASQQRAEVARALQALVFTHSDARSTVLAALEPLLRAMVARILPEIAQAALVPQIAAVLAAPAAAAAEAPLELVVSPGARGAVEAWLETRGVGDLRIVDDPALGAAQVTIRQGDAETRIDLDGAVTAITTLIADFFDDHRRT